MASSKKQAFAAHFISIFPAFCAFLAPALHYSISINRFHCSSIAAATTITILYGAMANNAANILAHFTAMLTLYEAINSSGL